MQQYNISRQATKLTIARLLLQETGTYNPVQHRPYVSFMTSDGLNNLVDTVREYGAASTLNAATIAGAVGNIVSPSAETFGEVSIAGGWQERRIQFVLEVHANFNVGASLIYFIQGYTDFPGVTMAGNVAPDMRFFINSIQTVNRVNVNTPYGMQTQDHIQSACQVLTENRFNSNYTPGASHAIRPQDIFRGMQLSHLAAGGDIYDSRSMLSMEACVSNRNNTLPSNYVAKVLDGYQKGQALSDWGAGKTDMLDACRGQVAEGVLSNNAFIRRISDDAGFGITNNFTFGSLERIDPNVRAVTTVTVVGRTAAVQSHFAGRTEYWTGSNRETQVATILSNAVPALMQELLISQISFSSTNQAVGGRMVTVIANAFSLTNADLTQHFDIFTARLEKEIIFDFTFCNQEIYALEMQVDIFGETKIKLSLNCGPFTDYVTPQLADALFTPVISNNPQSRLDLMNSFETLVESAADATSTRRTSALQGNV